MLTITLHTNSNTFLSGILLQEIVFELFHFVWDTQLYRVLLKTCASYISIIKRLQHEVMPTRTRTT